MALGTFPFRLHNVIAIIVIGGNLAACSIAPEKPDAMLVRSAPSEWQAPTPDAEFPAAQELWWASWNDPVMLQLQAHAQQHSPDLAQASARISQARALAAAAGAGLWPSLDLNASLTGSRNPLIPPGVKQTVSSIGLDARWEIDLFGANQAKRSDLTARYSASESEWQDARISLAAEVANAYVTLRSCEAQSDALNQVSESQQLTLQLQQRRNEAGFISPLELSQQHVAAADAISLAQQQRNECQVLIKSLVLLCDIPESELRTKLTEGRTTIPRPSNFTVDTLPANVLLKRPDLRAAMHLLLASRFELDAAQARRYPSISLLGSINLLGIHIAGESLQGNSWSFGPSLTLPLLDAGKRSADVDYAQARGAEALAVFRKKTLMAVKEVEEAMLRLDLANGNLSRHQQIATADDMNMQSTEAGWRLGNINLLEKEQAHRQQLLGQRQLWQLQRDRASAMIALYKAVGGDWQAPVEATNTGKQSGVVQ